MIKQLSIIHMSQLISLFADLSHINIMYNHYSPQILVWYAPTYENPE